MSDCVYERVVLFVTADLANQEYRVKHKAGDDRSEENNAEHEQHDLAKVEQDPPDIQCNSKQDQADAEDQKEDGCFAAAHVVKG
jgi:hypothetical protein